MRMHPIFHTILGTDYNLLSIYQATALHLFKNDLSGWGPVYYKGEVSWQFGGQADVEARTLGQFPPFGPDPDPRYML